MRLNETRRLGDFTCLAMAVLFLAGFVALALKLREVQLVEGAAFTYDGSRQSVRRVKTAGERGRIIAFDHEGNEVVLAANRPARTITINPAAFRASNEDKTVNQILEAMSKAGEIIGRPSTLDRKDIIRHVRTRAAMPIVAWNNVTDDEIARFCEHRDGFEGFSCEEGSQRIYPRGSLACHLLGYVGRERLDVQGGDEKYNYVDFEMRGRAGLEDFYDSYLRGMSGEKRLTVDTSGFIHNEKTIIEPQKGPDLVLSLDVDVQEEAEKQLEGEKGACVVMDVDTGGIIALASSPGFDPNDFIPNIRSELYDALSHDKSKPLLNRATGGSYAPGSTFKPITAMAGLMSGLAAYHVYDCRGAWLLGKMRIRCSHAWGHYDKMDLAHALKDSCNPYFCEWGYRAGSNAVIKTARAFGLGKKTGLDFAFETPGVVPDDAWKREHWKEKWYPGDLPQMSIGQGMLLATPLQMARATAAIATGKLVKPRLNALSAASSVKLDYPESYFVAIRKGMELVVDGGTGRRAAEPLAELGVHFAGKTGTAEVGQGATRRKNTWFIAYAPQKKPRVALAIIVENGESGGVTAAPRAGHILRRYFEGRTGA